MKQLVKRCLFVWGIPLMILWFIGNLILDMCFYWEYEEKMQIFAYVLQTGAAETDAILTWLKMEEIDAEPDIVSGEEILEKYGFGSNMLNRYYAVFVWTCSLTAICTFLFACFLFYLAWRRERQYWHRGREWLKQIAANLQSFRDGNLTDWQLENTEDFKEDFNRITDQLRRLADYMLLIQEQAFEEKEKTKGLVTDISHQLRTPVAALDTCLSVLEQPDLNDAERLEFTGRCREGLEGLKALLDSLIQVSRMEAGMIQIEKKEAPILDTLVAAVNRIYPKASEKQIELAFDDTAQAEQFIVLQDTKWLCEAFVNLLENAVKYSPAGSSIRISIQKRSRFIRIEIADAGIGIPKEEYHKVFQRFYRGLDARAGSESGSGVGLYLVREIVGRHQGMVSVSSDYGKKRDAYPGSRFVVQLPMI